MLSLSEDNKFSDYNFVNMLIRRLSGFLKLLETAFSRVYKFMMYYIIYRLIAYFQCHITQVSWVSEWDWCSA